MRAAPGIRMRALLPLLLLAASIHPADAQGDCMPQGSVAIFMVYQAENPDSVFFSEDGCLAGGGGARVAARGRSAGCACPTR